jgi:hypothetical protein
MPESLRIRLGRERGIEMVTLSLTEEEASVLLQVLQSYLSDLRLEIAGNDSWDTGEVLKRENIFLKDLIRQLQWSECCEVTPERG